MNFAEKYGISRKNKYWTNEETEYLKNNYTKIGPWECAKNLQRTQSSIRVKYYKLLKEQNK